jgi:hypothetical protein
MYSHVKIVQAQRVPGMKMIRTSDNNISIRLKRGPSGKGTSLLSVILTGGLPTHTPPGFRVSREIQK